MIALYNREVTVTVVDKDVARIARWNSQHPPIYEPGLQEILRITRDGTNTYQFNQNRGGNPPAEISQVTVGRLPHLFFTTDMEKSVQTANIISICVSTPTKHESERAGSATDIRPLRLSLLLSPPMPNRESSSSKSLPCPVEQQTHLKTW